MWFSQEMRAAVIGQVNMRGISVGQVAAWVGVEVGLARCECQEVLCLHFFTWTRGDRTVCLLDTAAYVRNDTQ